MFKHILVPTDGGKLSFKALDLAATMVQSSDAKITVVLVTPNYPSMGGGDGYLLAAIAPRDWEKNVAARIDRVRKDVEKRLADKKAAANFVSVNHDDVYVGVLDTAKSRKCDLIVMASHGRRGLSALLMGSETHKVLTHSKLPVLVCR